VTNQLLIMGVLHPARILRGGYSLEPAQVAYLEHAWEVLAQVEQGQPPTLVDTTLPAPNAITSPGLSDLIRWSQGPLSEGISVDLECAGEHLRGVGFCRLADLTPLWVPFRRQGGGQYWPNRDQLLRAVEWMDGVLGSPDYTKWFHNCVFDVPYLRRLGFQVSNPIDDTMLLAHVYQPEMRKGLQWLATTHLRLPMWKALLEAEDEEGGKE
jgi:hypothetical protein